MNSESMLFTSFLFNIHLLRYLQGGSSGVTSLDGHNWIMTWESTRRLNRLNLFNKHFIDGQKRADVGVQTLYVTAEERAVAEDIRNSSKDEILQRNSDKVQQISDEEVRGPLSGDPFQKKENLVMFYNEIVQKKENLVMFYNEIVEELQQLQVQRETAYVVEEKGQCE